MVWRDVKSQNDISEETLKVLTDAEEKLAALKASEDSAQKAAEAAQKAAEEAQAKAEAAQAAAEKARAEADAARQAALTAAELAGENKTAAEGAAKAAAEAEGKAADAVLEAQKAQAAAADAADAAEKSDAAAAQKAAAAAAAAADAAEDKASSAESAAAAAQACLDAQKAQAAAEEAQKKAEEAAEQAASDAKVKLEAADQAVAEAEAAKEAAEKALAEIMDRLDLDCASKDYTDVAADGWYHEAVDYMIANGYMNGVSETLFDVNGSVTRAQLVTILYRIEGEPSVDGLSNPFTDVAADTWYTDAVVWAANEGVVKGGSEISFDPNAKITREQIVTILYRYDGENKVEENALADYSDAATVSAYAADAMNWAITNGIVNGMTETTLAPRDNASRAQISAIVMRYLEN